MNDTERYLNAATRGLWGRQRRALRAELRGHITARVQEFRLGGCSEPEAERQTLRELGAPVRVSGGMLGVHTLPALGKAGALSALLMTGLLTVLPQGLAQVGSILDSRFGTYVDLKQLQAEFKKSGGDIAVDGTTLYTNVPGVGGSVFSGHMKSNYEQPSTGLDSRLSIKLLLEQKGRTFINLDLLLFSFMNRGSGLPVSVSGWKNPVLSIGSVKAPITGDTVKVAKQLYMGSMNATLPQLTGERNIIVFNPLRDAEVHQRTFSGKFQAGSVYALLVSLPGQNGMKMMTAAIGPAVSTTKLSLNAPAIGPFKFYDDATNFQRGIVAFDLAESARKNSLEHKVDPLSPYPAVLLKLSGKFGKNAYTIVPSISIK